MKRLALTIPVIAALTLPFGAAQADETTSLYSNKPFHGPENVRHLYREQSPFVGGGERPERLAFPEAFRRDVVARVIVLMGRSSTGDLSDYALSVRQRPDGYSLVLVSVPSVAYFDRSLPAFHEHHGKTMRCVWHIGNALAEKLVAGWKETLQQATSEDSSGWKDASLYNFAMDRDGHPLEGWMDVPYEYSPPGRLIDIVRSVNDACPAHKRKHLLDLQRQVDDLLASLKAEAKQ